MKWAFSVLTGLLLLAPSVARAACSATYPVGNPNDSVVSFLSGGTNLPFVGPSTFQSVEAGTLTYDSTTNTLQLCDGTAWRTIASTASGATVGFYASSSQGITTTLTQVGSYSIFRNDGSGLNAATGIFSAPVDGWYQFNSNVFFANANAAGVNNQIFIDGGARCNGFEVANSGNFYSTCNASYYMTAGKTAYVNVQAQGGSTTGSTIFSGYLASGGVGGSGSTSQWSSGASGAIYYSGGIVGIGTTGPNYLLDVQGGGSDLIRIKSSGASAVLLLQDAGTTASNVAVNSSGNDLVLRSGGSDRLRILANGNVGVGTSSPFRQFTVGDSAATANSNMSINSSNGYQSALGFANAGVDKSIIYRPASSNDLRVWLASPGDVMTFQTTTGNVGIGTTNPTERLDLSGGSIAMGYEIKTSTVAANSASGWYFVYCSAGKQALGGGCASSGGSAPINTNLSASAFGCWVPPAYTANVFSLEVACANIK